MGMPAAGLVNTAQGAPEGIDLALITQFLPLGQFNQFQDFFHLRQRLSQRFDNVSHFTDGMADGRTFRHSFRW